MDTPNFETQVAEINKKPNDYGKYALALVVLLVVFALGYVVGSRKENVIPALPTDESISLEYQLSPEEELELTQEENNREAPTEPVTFTNDEMEFTLTLPAMYSVLTTRTQVDTLDPDVTVAYFDLPVNSPREDGPTAQTMFGITRYPVDYDISTRGPMGAELGRSNGYAYRYFQSMDLAIDSDLPEYQIFLSLSALTQEDVERGFKVTE